VTLPDSAGRESVIVSLYIPDAGAVKATAPVTGNPPTAGEASISHESVYAVPGISPETPNVML
jgi:hypothetical protein